MKHRIKDVIIPELFAPYLTKQISENSVLLNSEIAEESTIYNEYINEWHKQINILLKPGVIPILIRGKAWSHAELKSELSRNDPMTATGDKLTSWWNIQENLIFTSILKGIFQDALKNSHIHDISNATGSNSVIGANAVLDTKQLLGNSASLLTAIVMHSDVYTKLQKDNLVEYIVNSKGVVGFPRYLGYKIVINNYIIPMDNIYDTYLVTHGAFVRNEGVPNDITSIDIVRDVISSTDLLVTRRAFCLYPMGLYWNKKNIADTTPNNKELSDGENWVRDSYIESIGIAMLKHKI